MQNFFFLLEVVVELCIDVSRVGLVFGVDALRDIDAISEQTADVESCTDTYPEVSYFEDDSSTCLDNVLTVNFV